MSTPAQAQDVFDATRDVVNRLTPFAEEERSRIVRWAMEMLGISGYGSFKAPQPVELAFKGESDTSVGAAPLDIRSFVLSKRPKSDVQFTAVVAYFFQFISSSPLQDMRIEELREAHRQARRKPDSFGAAHPWAFSAAGCAERGGESPEVCRHRFWPATA